MRPAASSQWRVSWRTVSPPSSRSIWRSASWSMARPSERSELRFLISQRVPQGSPARLTETLASTRIEPSSILASLTPVARRMARSSLVYSWAWSLVRMSASDTISTSGTPERL